MKNLTRHTGELVIVERLKSSINGNPRYLCIIDGYTFRTTPDSTHGYSIPNHEGNIITVLLGTHYGATSLHSIEETYSK